MDEDSASQAVLGMQLAFSRPLYPMSSGLAAGPSAPLPGENGEGRSVYFVADAHLGSEAPEVEDTKERELIELLGYLEHRAAFLYLVGDVFDFWFEYPSVAPSAHGRVLEALSSLSRAGTRIRFLGGNHDYWAGGKLEALTGVTVHRDSVSETHFGRRLFIAHGDGLPRGDRGYRLLKAVIRSRAAIAGFRLIPPAIGAAIARWASGLSTITEERIERAIPSMRAFLEEKVAAGYDAAVVGHVHRPLKWDLPGGVAVIVGDWMANRAVAELTAEGFRLLRWSEGGLAEIESEPRPHRYSEAQCVAGE
jgi:UDP-2,3-diacylglucosamine hydrolase